ncbi:NAD(P)-dependent oxidoreductase [Mesorhizobium sp. M1340]|uniref:NAD(P)-dependent oxidoreductase n=1 Tax=Mesorhizobium sp. M1340 TaxID=2957087 RepID=UPI00333C61AA
MTPATTNLINAKMIAQMPDGPFIIISGRRVAVVDADLLAAPDRGQIEAAAQDVLRRELLGADDPFLSDPNQCHSPDGGTVERPVVGSVHRRPNSPCPRRRTTWADRRSHAWILKRCQLPD